VGVFWPGTFSLAAAGCPAGGTAMFALLALAGDLGCASGPATVGFVADASGRRAARGAAGGRRLSGFAAVGAVAARSAEGAKDGGARAGVTRRKERWA
jgi:hypothetical protein